MRGLLPLVLLGGAGYLIYKALKGGPQISVGPGISPGSSFSVTAPSQRLAMAQAQYQSMLQAGMDPGYAAALVKAQTPGWSPGM